MKLEYGSVLGPAVASVLCFAYITASAGTAMGLKDLPDAPRASVVKELARNQALARKDGKEERDSSVGGGARRSDDCNLSIDSDRERPRGASRNTTTVITGSVIQMCGR